MACGSGSDLFVPNGDCTLSQHDGVCFLEISRRTNLYQEMRLVYAGRNIGFPSGDS